MKKIKSLDESINNIQIHRFIDKMEKELNKITKELKKKMLIMIIPMLIIIINALYFAKFLYYVIGNF